MILMRRLLGDVLRQRRQRDGRTLRQVAAAARISPGYLSEIERGQKEPSSELLASICDALDVRLSDLMREVSGELAAAELATQMSTVSVPAPQMAPGTRIPATKIGARNTGAAPVAVSGAKPGARSARRPAARPVTRRSPIPSVPVGSSPVPTVGAAGLATNLPMSLTLAGELSPAGPGGVPAPMTAGCQVLMARDLFVTA